MKCIVGIDGGGTKTACVLVDLNGSLLAQGQSRASNYHAVGAMEAEAAIYDALAQALQTLDGTDAIEIVGMGLGLAGVASREDCAVVRGWVEGWIADALMHRSPPTHTHAHPPLRWALNPADHQQLYIDHDCAIALTGGVGDMIGIAAIAGTGSIVYGRNALGENHRVGGWGYLVGDEGSGYDIARQGIQAALRSADGRERQTALLPALLNQFNVSTPRELAIAVYRHSLPVRELAALSVLVDDAAREGDAVAQAILFRAASELSLAITACAHQLFDSDDQFPIVMIGGVWQAEGLQHLVYTHLSTEYPNAKLQLPHHSPAYGAALTVLRQVCPATDEDLEIAQPVNERGGFRSIA